MCSVGWLGGPQYKHSDTCVIFTEGSQQIRTIHGRSLTFQVFGAMWIPKCMARAYFPFISQLFPILFPIPITYSVFPKDCLLPIHFLEIKKGMTRSFFLSKMNR